MKRRKLCEGLSSVDQASTTAIETSDLDVLFKKHFEAQFQPLPDTGLLPRNIAKDDDVEDDISNVSSSVWEGLSDQDEPGAVLVQHHANLTATAENTSEEFKTFMSSKPPSSARGAQSKKGNSLPDDPDASTDAANLRKDLELQRLLKESHLLSSSTSGQSTNFAHSGVNRHKALDMRLQDLGSKSSIFKQDKMPLAQRQGIVARTKAQDEVRRREASENGIILEKPKTQRRNNALRERAIGAPSVGRFHGGTLKLTRKDVAEIEGPRKKSMGGKNGRRKRR